MGLCFLLQGIFPTQGLNPHLLGLLHCRGFLTTNDTWEAWYICMYVKYGIGSCHYGSWQVPKSVVSNLETQGELIFQFKFKGREKNPMFQLDSSQKENFLPTQHFFLSFFFPTQNFCPIQSIIWLKPVTLGRAICFSLSVQLLTSSRNIQSDVWPNICPCIPSPHW